MVQILTDHGALLNCRDYNQKETALSLAVYFGCEDNACYLIRHGADMTITDKRLVASVAYDISSLIQSWKRKPLASLTHWLLADSENFFGNIILNAIFVTNIILIFSKIALGCMPEIPSQPWFR